MSPVSSRFQPGWATPIALDLEKPSWLAWFLGFRDERGGCATRRQGRCPGLDQCHDCAWSISKAEGRDR